jgi:hypothetical protein
MLVSIFLTCAIIGAQYFNAAAPLTAIQGINNIFFGICAKWF